MNLSRIERLLARACGDFGLDLRGRTVLTEAATGAYGLTASLAARAGAARVLTLARDTRHGSAETAWAHTAQLAQRLGVAERVVRLSGRDDPRLGDAEAVTNLGAVRPLDAALLARLGPHAGIALMWETWEYRPEELDLPACRRLGIPVVGTDEHQPPLDTFAYTGHLALKLLYGCDVEVQASRIVVWGDGPLAADVVRLLKLTGASVTAWNTDDRHVPDALDHADALVLATMSRAPLLTDDGVVAPAALASRNPGLAVVHICGAADAEGLARAGLVHQPGRFAAPGWMSVTTATLGPWPMLALHAAGLRVAQELVAARRAGLAGRDAERVAAGQCRWAQPFPPADGEDP